MNPSQSQFPKPVDWKSPWPVGDANRTNYVPPKQNAPAAKPVDWKSPWPEGNPNKTGYVSPEQQTKNVQAGSKAIDTRTVGRGGNLFGAGRANAGWGGGALGSLGGGAGMRSNVNK